MEEPNDLLRMNLSALRGLRASQIPRRLRSDEIDHIFRTCGALWLHSGRPTDPHAELTGGKCSNGFVDTLRVLSHPNLCEIFGGQLSQRLRRNYRGPVEWVVGSDHAAATLSYEVASQLGCRHDFTEKGPGKTQLWKRHVIAPNDPILQVEELVTETTTLQAVRTGLRQSHSCHLRFVPFIPVLVHRSKRYELEGAPIIYLRHYDIQTWDPDDCPLCQAGSKRLRPKTNWAELTAPTP